MRTKYHEAYSKNGPLKSMALCTNLKINFKRLFKHSVNICSMVMKQIREFGEDINMVLIDLG